MGSIGDGDLRVAIGWGENTRARPVNPAPGPGCSDRLTPQFFVLPYSLEVPKSVGSIGDGNLCVAIGWGGNTRARYVNPAPSPGCRGRLTPHFLVLPSYGVAAVTAGVPLPTVAAVLGHASLTTTAIYTTAIGAEARELVSRVWA